jgi:hypothetical protein
MDFRIIFVVAERAQVVFTSRPSAKKGLFVVRAALEPRLYDVLLGRWQKSSAYGKS